MKNFIAGIVILILTLYFCESMAASSTINAVVKVDDVGAFTVTGSIQPSGRYQVTIKIVEQEGGLIKYIDQISSDASGRFSFVGKISSYSKTRAYSFLIGGSNINSPSEYTWIKYNLNSVPDNSIRVGEDIYELNSRELTSQNIITSIKNGGNTIYFKLAGAWYDVMNPLAINMGYFLSESNKENTGGWNISKWYTENNGVLILN